MKQLVTIFFLFLAVNLNAQVAYGTIDYVRVNEMSFSSNGVDDKVMAGLREQMMAAGAFTDNFKATFSPDAFTFVEVAKEVVSIETEIGGGGVMIMETGGKEPSSFYTNTKNATVLNRNFIFDKGFLVEGPVENLEWTLTDETIVPSEATIGLDLRVATAVTSSGDTITAGYAPSLPIQVGPRNFYGLPGAIITLHVSKSTGGSTNYRATKLTVSNEPLALDKPTEGKRITPGEFRSETAKKQKMMKRKYKID